MGLSTKLGVVAVALAALAACAPRVVTDISITSDQAKLVYARNTPFGAETGIVQCARQEDGSLTNCKKLPITWRRE